MNEETATVAATLKTEFIQTSLDMKAEFTKLNIASNDAFNVEFENLKTKDMKEMIENVVTQKIIELEAKIELGKKASVDFKKEPRCLTTKRNFGFLPKYSGKHEEYDDWKLKMSTFLSELLEFKELMAMLEKQVDVPDEEKAVNMIATLPKILKETDDKGDRVSWVNHQL